MATIREIKRRIKSVQNTQKITRAMKMVSATKLRKAQDKTEKARPFFTKTMDILRGAAATIDTEAHPLLAHREVKKVHILAITADRGLCGGYNQRVIKMIEQEINKNDSDRGVSISAAGKKGRDAFLRKGYPIINQYIDLPDDPDFELAQKTAQDLIQIFLSQEADLVLLAYTRFQSALTHRPLLIPILPVEKRETEDKRSGVREYIMEPDPATILDLILPKYVENVIYATLLESKASEFGARMTAMDSATENAQEMIEKLTISYNRARQEEITKEISEIVGGAEALK